MDAERTGSPRQMLLSWGSILLAVSLLLLAAACRAARAAPPAEHQPVGATQAQSLPHQDAEFLHITNKQGLSDLRVLTLLQDRDGFI